MTAAGCIIVSLCLDTRRWNKVAGLGLTLSDKASRGVVCSYDDDD